MADPVVTITNGVPVTGTGTITTLGQTLLDGAQVTQGAIADAAVTAGATGTISAKLRSISRDIVSNIVLAAGSALIGKVDVQFAGTVPDTGAGTGGSKTQRFLVDSSQLDPIVAHDAVDSGSPYKQGFRAITSLSGLTLVSAADRTDGFAGVDGVQIVRPHCNLEDIVATGSFTDTAGTSTSAVVAQGAGIKTYVTSVILCNTSATAVTVAIKDGTTTKVTLPLPAGSGCVYNPPVPIPGTANTAWNFQTSAAATTVTCSIIGFKSKV